MQCQRGAAVQVPGAAAAGARHPEPLPPGAPHPLLLPEEHRVLLHAVFLPVLLRLLRSAPSSHTHAHVPHATCCCHTPARAHAHMHARSLLREGARPSMSAKGRNQNACSPWWPPPSAVILDPCCFPQVRPWWTGWLLRSTTSSAPRKHPSLAPRAYRCIARGTCACSYRQPSDGCYGLPVRRFFPYVQHGHLTQQLSAVLTCTSCAAAVALGWQGAKWGALCQLPGGSPGAAGSPSCCSPSWTGRSSTSTR